MKIDKFGVAHRKADELCSLLYVNPDIDLHHVPVDNPEEFNRSIKELFYDFKPLPKYHEAIGSIEEFDTANQSNWHMPQSYKDMDIAKWCLDQCQTEEELQRVGKELMMYQDRDLLPLLQFMKYFVDIMRKNNVVWGVGRGSSTASYVLFLIGVHKIDALYYGLTIEEFIK